MGLANPGMLSRRDFVNGTIGAGVTLAAQGARTATAQMNTPKRTIVDAQVHLWKAESPDWPWVLGIRLTFLGPQAAWLTDGTANWIWPAAEKAGLPIMFLAPGRSATFAPIAERHPGLTVIIDHMNAGPAIKENNQLDDAIAQTVALAKYPNVSCKISASPALSSEP